MSAGGVTTIAEDRSGRLWLGTYGSGLDSFDPESERFSHYRHDPKDASSLPGDRVSSVSEAPDGKLWVGTMEKGLALLDPRTGRFTRLAHTPGDPGSLPSNTVYSVFTDAAGGLWAGTNGGLSHLDCSNTSAKRNFTRWPGNHYPLADFDRARNAGNPLPLRDLGKKYLISNCQEGGAVNFIHRHGCSQPIRQRVE